MDVIEWPGKPEDELRKLVIGIRAVLGTPAAPELAARRTVRSSRSLWLPASIAFALLLSIGYYYRETIAFSLAMNLPALYFGSSVDHDLGFTVVPDGTRIAAATAGEGPPILHVLGQNTHLEKGQNAPIYDNDGLIAMSARNNQFVMYDGRGTGLSDRNVEDWSLEARIADIEAVVESAGLDRFSILAVSGGGMQANVYAARNPTRVDRLVLAGTFVSFSHLDTETRQMYEKALDLFEVALETTP